MIGVGSVLSDLGRLCFYQLKPVATLTSLGWSLLHHHPVDVRGIFLAWKRWEGRRGKNREREGKELEEEEEGRGRRGRGGNWRRKREGEGKRGEGGEGIEGGGKGRQKGQ